MIDGEALVSGSRSDQCMIDSGSEEGGEGRRGWSDG
jgi:hypothetical protein